MSASMTKRITKKRNSTTPVKPTKVSYRKTLLDFKLQLIAEVKKHEVIWRNPQRKNKKFSNAWMQVLNALTKAYNRRPIRLGKKKHPELEHCRSSWRKLKKEYKQHVASNKTLQDELAVQMSFMASELQHDAVETNYMYCEPTETSLTLNGTTVPPETKTIIDMPVNANGNYGLNLSSPEANELQFGPSTSTPNDKAQPPKVKKVETCNSGEVTSKDSSTDRIQALAVIEYLFSALPTATLADLRAALVRVFIRLQPEDTKKIINHATLQMSIRKDYLKIDWSELAISAKICQAVWLSHVYETIQQRLPRREN